MLVLVGGTWRGVWQVPRAGFQMLLGGARVWTRIGGAGPRGVVGCAGALRSRRQCTGLATEAPGYVRVIPHHTDCKDAGGHAPYAGGL